MIRGHRLVLAAGAQPGTGGPAGSAAGGCVVFFTRRADAEVSVIERLLALAGVPTRRVDADALGPIQLDLARLGALRIGEELVRPTACWTRRFWSSAMTDPRTAAGLLRRQSWLALVRQSRLLAPHDLPGPRLGLLEQLAGAAAAGVRVPATVVTTAPARGATRLPGDRVVVKTLGPHFVEPEPGTLDGVLPRILPRDELADGEGPVPLVVQEYVPHLAEYRVYAIGNRLVAFEVRKPSPEAIWHDQQAVQVRQADCPEQVAGLVTELAARWRLGFGAFDVLLTGDGAVLLEVNADGDWLWYEAKAGTRAVSRQVALAVRDLHLAAGGRLDGTGAGLPALLGG